MTVPEKFTAIGVHDFDNWLDAKTFEYTPHPIRPYDIDIKITACGVCGSDIHAANGDWGRPYAPVAVGHEIIGTVVAVGKDVTKVKVGERVGVGAQCDSCGACTRCGEHLEQTCKKNGGTYFGVLSDGSGYTTQGGYASHVRVNNKFAFKIPDGLDTIYVAPLMCGGITGFNPLLKFGVKKGTKVGVSGVGGIGHMTILFAKAMGAEVTAISRTSSKLKVAKDLGVDHYIATDEPDFAENHHDTLDLIVATGSSFSKAAFSSILGLLKPYGKLTFITAPPESETLVLSPTQLLMNDYSVGGSGIGSPDDIEYMLKFAAEHDIKPWVETLDINEKNVRTAWERMTSGDVKFRFVLTGYEKYFK